jgi:hypothetical protein
MYTQPKVVSVVEAGSSIMSVGKGEGPIDNIELLTMSTPAYEADE